MVIFCFVSFVCNINTFPSNLCCSQVKFIYNSRNLTAEIKSLVLSVYGTDDMTPLPPPVKGLGTPNFSDLLF